MKQEDFYLAVSLMSWNPYPLGMHHMSSQPQPVCPYTLCVCAMCVCAVCMCVCVLQLVLMSSCTKENRNQQMTKAADVTLSRHWDHIINSSPLRSHDEGSQKKLGGV